MKARRKQLPGILMALGFVLPAALMAQNDQQMPSPTQPGAVQRPGSAQLSADDRKFLQDAAIGGIEEVDKDIREFRKVAEHGADADIKSFAAGTLPKLHDHLAMARDAARTAKAGEHGKQSTTGTASDQVHDRTTGAAGDNASGEAQSERNHDSTAPAQQGQSKR